jgi:hypothetical protein
MTDTPANRPIDDSLSALEQVSSWLSSLGIKIEKNRLSTYRRAFRTINAYIADNTIVVYTTDNGAEVMTWPDAGSTPFRGEKATNWDGGFRVPTVIRWPGVIKPGTIYNDMFADMDFLPTFCAAAGDPDVLSVPEA